MAQEFAGRLRRQALLPRVLTVFVGVPVVLALLWLGGAWWLILAAVILVLGAMEYASLRALTQRNEIVLRLASLLMFVLIAVGPEMLGRWLLAAWALVIFTLGLIPMVLTGVMPPAGGEAQASSVILGIAYLATPFAVLVRWRLDLGPQSVLAFLIVIWANDIAAYFVGLAVGRHKLAPRVSPGKSWEGAAGGLAGGLIAGLLLFSFLGPTRGAAAVWAVIVTIVSQGADLFESILKRRAGVKDSGRLLPGHGGVLDRFDGILLACPAGYVLLRLFGGR
ncbi:MAG TPA: phosphatidate cytidylyltransferase [bacterium]